MSQQDMIESLLSRWEEMREQGHEATAEELCHDRPEIWPELARRINQLKAMDWLDNPLSESSPAIRRSQAEESQGPGIGDCAPINQSNDPRRT